MWMHCAFDAVASMIYLDYSGKMANGMPISMGVNENLDAISLLKEMNQYVYDTFDGVQTIAEESTGIYRVSKSVDAGGLGFGMKWMMGWMHDTLTYFKKNLSIENTIKMILTFSMTYAFTENFMLPFSHDEVVYGKQSLLYRMPGDEWPTICKFKVALLVTCLPTQVPNLYLWVANLGNPQKWNFQESLDWHLTQYEFHSGTQKLVKDLNLFYKNNPALYEKQFSPEGFTWIDYGDAENSVLAYIRKGHDTKNDLIVICNFTPLTRKFVIE